MQGYLKITNSHIMVKALAFLPLLINISTTMSKIRNLFKTH